MELKQQQTNSASYNIFVIRPNNSEDYQDNFDPCLTSSIVYEVLNEAIFPSIQAQSMNIRVKILLI